MKAIVLAGTTPHIALINKLKQRGYETILIDGNPNCPARSSADRFIEESTLDYEAVLRIATEEKVDLVIAIVGDHINAVCCYVAEKLGLPHPYSYENALNATRKSRMKPLFDRYGITTPEYYILDREEKREIRLDFPLVVKPSDANSSKGVFCVTNEEEFYDKIEQAFQHTKEGKVIVEKYIGGVEIEINCLAINQKAHICVTKALPNLPLNGKELNIDGYRIPGEPYERDPEQISEIAQKICDAYQLKNGAFFYQAKYCDGKVYVMEAAARMGGGTIYESTNYCCGIDYVDLAIDGFLGKTITQIPHYNGRKFVGKALRMKPGIFDKVVGTDQYLADGTLYNYWVFAKSGTKVTDRRISTFMLAVLLVECDSYDEGYEKINRALQGIAILDTNGNDVSDWR